MHFLEARNTTLDRVYRWELFGSVNFGQRVPSEILDITVLLKKGHFLGGGGIRKRQYIRAGHYLGAAEIENKVTICRGAGDVEQGHYLGAAEI